MALKQPVMYWGRVSIFTLGNVKKRKKHNYSSDLQLFDLSIANTMNSNSHANTSSASPSACKLT